MTAELVIWGKRCMIRRVRMLVLLAILAAGCVKNPSVQITQNVTAVVQASATPAVNPDTASQARAARSSFGQEFIENTGIPFYDFDIFVDDLNAAFRGTLKLTYLNQEGIVLDSLAFRLFPNGGKSYGAGWLEVEEIFWDHRKVPPEFSLDNTVMEIPLTGGLEPGKTAQIKITFSGKIPEDFQGGGYGLFNQSQGVTVLSGWIPLLAVYDDEGWNLDPVSSIGDSVYSDAAFFHGKITLRDGLTAAATGTEINQKKLDEGLIIREYVSGPAREFALVLGEKLNRLSITIQDTRINSYYLPGDEDAARLALETAGASLEIFNQAFGQYPFAELDVVEVPMRYAAGIEFPGLVLLGESIYQSEAQSWFRTVVAHEVAHQWWYNLVGSDVIDEPWLDEALTTYSSIIYFEEAFGETAYQEMRGYYQQSYQRAVDGGNDHPVTESLGYFESTAARKSAYSPIVYSKGALFFDAVRQEIGDENFFAGLRKYFYENRYQIGTPEELLLSFEESSGRDLGELFDHWLK